ncbi:hypothetical protein [Glutamicibacter sp. X7]
MLRLILRTLTAILLAVAYIFAAGFFEGGGRLLTNGLYASWDLVSSVPVDPRWPFVYQLLTAVAGLFVIFGCHKLSSVRQNPLPGLAAAGTLLLCWATVSLSIEYPFNPLRWELWGTSQDINPLQIWFKFGALSTTTISLAAVLLGLAIWQVRARRAQRQIPAIEH